MEPIVKENNNVLNFANKTIDRAAESLQNWYTKQRRNVYFAVAGLTLLNLASACARQPESALIGRTAEGACVIKAPQDVSETQVVPNYVRINNNGLLGVIAISLSKDNLPIVVDGTNTNIIPFNGSIQARDENKVLISGATIPNVLVVKQTGGTILVGPNCEAAIEGEQDEKQAVTDAIPTLAEIPTDEPTATITSTAVPTNTSTPIPPTATRIPVSPTSTLQATNTSVPATATLRPVETATSVRPTSTPASTHTATIQPTHTSVATKPETRPQASETYFTNPLDLGRYAETNIQAVIDAIGSDAYTVATADGVQGGTIRCNGQNFNFTVTQSSEGTLSVNGAGNLAKVDENTWIYAKENPATGKVEVSFQGNCSVVSIN